MSSSALSRIDDLLNKVSPPKTDEANLTKAAREFISDKISKLADEHPDWDNKRRVAAAHSMARDAGYDVPKPSNEAHHFEDEPEKPEDKPKEEPEDKPEDEEPEKKDEPEVKQTEADDEGEKKKEKEKDDDDDDDDGEPKKKEPPAPAFGEPSAMVSPGMVDQKYDEAVEEALSLPRTAIEIAKAEFRSFTDFMEQYKGGDENAFKTEVGEGDDPAVMAKKERPPQAWFEHAVRMVEGDPGVDDPAALVSWLWYNWVGSDARAKIKGE